MKKLILACVTSLIIVLVGCGESRTTTDLSGNMDYYVQEDYPEEVRFVLNRDIFVFKDEFPELYTTVATMDETVAYVADWKLGKILNEDNFKNIEWEVTSRIDEAKTVIFSGESKLAQVYTKVVVEFFIQDDAKFPLVWSMTGIQNEDEAVMSVNELVEDGMAFEQALFGADSSICCILTAFSKSAMSSASEYFENLAQECMEKKDFDKAIGYYEQAGTVGDKLYAAYYAKAEKALDNGDFDMAGQYFGYAQEYSDASVRKLEVYYKSGEEYEEKNDYISAVYFYSMAGNYSDAIAKYKECNFKQGEKYFENKQYSDAIACFEEAGDYDGAYDEYLEANYLYGEALLLTDNPELAKTYFYNAKGYKDADTKVQRYYYENGINLLNSFKYIEAANQFILANTYSDAQSMEKECYYCYGKQQFELNYITDAIEYLTKCRGYKDTDDILFGYYYSEATVAVDTFINSLPEHTFTRDVSDAYNDAKNKLVLCEGYKDSNHLLKIVEKLYYVWSNMDSVSMYNSSLMYMTASYSENIINITKERFFNGSFGDLFLSYNMGNNMFNANINSVYCGSAREFGIADGILAIIELFTDIENMNDLKTKFKDQNSWVYFDDNESFSMSYGGYNILIETTMVDPYSYSMDCKISATK